MSDQNWGHLMNAWWCGHHLQLIDAKLQYSIDNLDPQMIRDLGKSLHIARCALEHADQRILSFSGPLTRKRKRAIDEWMQYKRNLKQYH